MEHTIIVLEWNAKKQLRIRNETEPSPKRDTLLYKRDGTLKKGTKIYKKRNKTYG